MTWEVKNAAYAILRPLNLSVSPSGSLVVNDAADTTYTLEARLGEQSTQKTITVRRDANPPLTIVNVQRETTSYRTQLVSLVLLGKENFCLPQIEFRWPDKKVEKFKTYIASSTHGGRRHLLQKDFGDLAQNGSYAFRISVVQSTDPTDCSTAPKKHLYFPAWDGQGEAPWETFTYKKTGGSTEPPPTCTNPCEQNELRCNGKDYQICETSAYQCNVWSVPIACPQGSQCTANGSACFTSITPPDRTTKEIKVNPGTFRYGASIGNNYQGTPTTLSHGFYLWKHEFTHREYLLLLQPKKPKNLPLMPDQENHPATPDYYSWGLYVLNVLSQQYNLPPCYTCTGTFETSLSCEPFPQYKGNNITQCQGYRLPTEAEWEYAYRAGTHQDFYNGNLRSALEETNPHLDAIAWYKANSQGKLQPVGLKQPNAWGFYDMAGNAVEWTANYEKRGGGVGSPAHGCTAYNNTYGSNFYGFRPARTAP